MKHADIVSALRAMGFEVLTGKGGFYARRDGSTSFLTLAQARKLTGIVAESSPRRERITAYGDYAIIAALSGRLNG